MADYSALRSNCTAMNDNGSFCDAASLPDAPFGICLTHAAALLQYLNRVLPEQPTGSTLSLVRDLEREVATDGEHRPVVIPDDLYFEAEVVYYLRIGRYIKIGYTTNLTQRLRHYPPDAVLLAWERGDRQCERRRLVQFARDRRARSEWFEPTVALLSHVHRLNAAATA